MPHSVQPTEYEDKVQSNYTVVLVQGARIRSHELVGGPQRLGFGQGSFSLAPSLVVGKSRGQKEAWTLGAHEEPTANEITQSVALSKHTSLEIQSCHLTPRGGGINIIPGRWFPRPPKPLKRRRTYRMEEERNAMPHHPILHTIQKLYRCKRISASRSRLH